MTYNGITLLIGILTVGSIYIVITIYDKKTAAKELAKVNNKKTINFFLKGDQ